jgi:hypothetical protein
MDIMKIAHGEIHPALLTSYKLQLRSLMIIILTTPCHK